MSQKDRVHFKIALPVDLKRSLEHAAIENRRSLSAEIISRLETTLQMDLYEPQENIGSDPIEPELTPNQKRLLKKLLAKMEEDEE